MAASIKSGSIFRSSPQSTKTGLAPVVAIDPTVAKKVKGVVITSSPLSTPRTFKLKKRASVPLPTPIACFVPQRAAYSFSTSSTVLPRVKSPLITTSFIF